MQLVILNGVHLVGTHLSSLCMCAMTALIPIFAAAGDFAASRKQGGKKKQD